MLTFTVRARTAITAAAKKNNQRIMDSNVTILLSIAIFSEKTNDMFITFNSWYTQLSSSKSFKICDIKKNKNISPVTHTHMQALTSSSKKEKKNQPSTLCGKVRGTLQAS